MTLLGGAANSVTVAAASCCAVIAEGSAVTDEPLPDEQPTTATLQTAIAATLRGDMWLGVDSFIRYQW
jgi:hypothetical protein